MKYDPHIWKKKVLVEPIEEVVLSPEMFELTRIISEECYGASYGSNRLEQGGFLEGVLNQNKFYVFLQNGLDMSGDGALTFRDLRWPEADIIDRLSKEIDGYRTVMYHGHYRLTMETLWKFFRENYEEVKDLIQDEINQGIHDHFFKDKIEIPPEILEESSKEIYLRGCKFDKVLNEIMTRTLSEEDIKSTVGEYHLIISPTLSDSDTYNHLNFYRLRRKEHGLDERTKIRVATKKERIIFESLNKRVKKVIKESARAILGFDFNKSKLSDEEWERMYLIFEYGIDPDENNQSKSGESEKDKPFRLELAVY